MFEMVTANRPTTRSVASITIHFCWTVLAFAMNVDIAPTAPFQSISGKPGTISNAPAKTGKTVMLRSTDGQSSPRQKVLQIGTNYSIEALASQQRTGPIL